MAGRNFRLNHSRDLAGRGDDPLDGEQASVAGTGYDDTRDVARRRAEARARVKRPKRRKRK